MLNLVVWMNEVYKMYGCLLQVYTDRRMDPIIVVFKVTMTNHARSLS